jgi:hypothetical protein
LSIDRDTREIIGVYIGDRGHEGAGESIPWFYRQNTRRYTDLWGLIRAFFQQTVGKKPAKPIILSGLTVPSDNAFLAWLEKRCLLPENLKIISARFGILFIPIMPIFVTN